MRRLIAAALALVWLGSHQSEARGLLGGMSGKLTANNVFVPITPGDGSGSTYALVFDDEFNGTSLDTTNWATGWFGTGLTDPVQSTENACYDPANVTVSGGYLHIAAVGTSCTVGSNTYTNRGGLISSAVSGSPSVPFTFTFGYAEARVYSPVASGSTPANWDAWWMEGVNWPTDGEIDVWESLSGGGGGTWHGPPSGTGQGNFRPSGNWTGWHVYGMIWTSTAVSWYYDGNLIGTVTNGVGGVTVTNFPMSLIIDYTVGGCCGGPILVPNTMMVDYVHVYQNAAISNALTPNSPVTAITPQTNYGGPGANGP